MPGASNENLFTRRAIGRLSRIIKNIAHIAILDTRGEGDLPCAFQGFGGSLWLVPHSEIWMKCGEMKRHIVAEISKNPVAKVLGLFCSIILTRYHQVGNFEPDFSFVLKPLKRIQYGVEMGKCYFMI